MPIDTGGASNMLKLAGGEEELDWLTLTAQEDGTTVQLNWQGADYPKDGLTRVEARQGREPWQELVWDEAGKSRLFTLNRGEFCQFRAVDVNTMFSRSFYGSSVLRFYIQNGSVHLSGDIMTLIDKSLKFGELNYCSFCSLFYLQGSSAQKGNALTGVLPAQRIAYTQRDYSLYLAFSKTDIEEVVSFYIGEVKSGDGATNCFSENLKLRKVGMIDMPLREGAHKGMFNACSRLSDITVAWHQWVEGSLVNWVFGVSPTGDFHCPSSLPRIFDNSHIPQGWTVHSEGQPDEPYEDFLNVGTFELKDAGVFSGVYVKSADETMPGTGYPVYTRYGSPEFRLEPADSGYVFTDGASSIACASPLYSPAAPTCCGSIPLLHDTTYAGGGQTYSVSFVFNVDPLEDKYLCFTSEEAGSALRLNKSADVPELNARLEYKINNGTWQKYTWGDKESETVAPDPKLGKLINLASVGDKVKFRAEDVNETFSVDDGNYGSHCYKYKFTGKVNGSGELASLLSKSISIRDLPNNCFSYLFQRSEINDSKIILDFNNIGNKSMWLCFDDCKSINSHQMIKAVTVGYFGLVSLFPYSNITSLTLDISDTTNDSLKRLCYSCRKLSSIQVSFKNWYPGGNQTWVTNVWPTGTFTCPAELPVIFDDSHIPWGWKVDNGNTEVTEEEELNACYRYNNGQLIIQPDFKACLNKEVQTDYVWKGKVYWKAGTPLPNPHRPDWGEHYVVTSLNSLFFKLSRIVQVDVSLFDFSEITDISFMYDGTSVSQIDLSGVIFPKPVKIFRFCGYNAALRSVVLGDMLVSNASRMCEGSGLNLVYLDFSRADFSLCTTVGSLSAAFAGCKYVTTAYARTQEDADKLNASTDKPTTWQFTVHPDLLNVPSFTLAGAGDFSGQYRPTGNLTPEGLPVYASEVVFNYKMKPTKEADGKIHYVFFSEQGLGSSYVCNTPLDEPVAPEACTGKRQLLRDLTYTGGDGVQHTVQITFP